MDPHTALLAVESLPVSNDDLNDDLDEVLTNAATEIRALLIRYNVWATVRTEFNDCRTKF